MPRGCHRAGGVGGHRKAIPSAAAAAARQDVGDVGKQSSLASRAAAHAQPPSNWEDGATEVMCQIAALRRPIRGVLSDHHGLKELCRAKLPARAARIPSL